MLAIGFSRPQAAARDCLFEECPQRVIVGARRIEVRQVPGARHHHALRERQRAGERLARAAADRRVEFAVHDQHRLHEARERGGAGGRRRRIGGAAQVVRRVAIQHARGELARRGVGRMQPHQRVLAPGAPECLDALLRDQPAVLRDREILVAGRRGVAGLVRRAVQHQRRDALRVAQRKGERDARALRDADERRGLEPQVIDQPAEVLRVRRAARRPFGKPEAAAVVADHAVRLGERRGLRLPGVEVERPAMDEDDGAPAPSSRTRNQASPDRKLAVAEALHRFRIPKKSSHSGYGRPPGASSSRWRFRTGRKARGRARARARRKSRGSPGAASRAARARSAPW